MDSEGKVSEQRRHEVQSKFEKLAKSLLDGEGISRRQLDDVPAFRHKVVEDFFRQTWLCLVKTFVKFCLKYSKIYVKLARKEADLKKKL